VDLLRSSNVLELWQLNDHEGEGDGSRGGTFMFSNLSPFTKLHVVISLIGIVSGLVVMSGLLVSRRLNGWTALFLISTVLTSVTGLLFPFNGVTPGIVLAIISLVLLAVAIVARYARHLSGAWRWIYVVTAMISLYLNVFVLVAQLFQKVTALKALAPTQSEPPFAVTQLVVLAMFVLLTILAAIRFRGEGLRRA
jgi:hypothetical protein